MIATEVWLTPLLLLPGVALLIVSTSHRFAQLHSEFHRLLDHPDDHAKIGEYLNRLTDVGLLQFLSPTSCISVHISC